MHIAPVKLKAALYERITNRLQYPEKLTVVACLTCAAELACEVIDMLATADSKPAETGRRQERRRPGQGRPDSSRQLAANEKRGRVLKVLRQEGAPLRMGEIGRKAMLTPGECSYLLKTTAGVVQVGPGRYQFQEAQVAPCIPGHVPGM